MRTRNQARKSKSQSSSSQPFARAKVAEPNQVPITGEHSRPIAMADNDRPMTEHLQAPTGGFEDAIVIPQYNPEHFELKAPFITLVQASKFYGEGNDCDPHGHLRYFEKIVHSFRTGNVAVSTVKLILFPFSIDGAAKRWLEKEPPRSILTWEELKSKFINKFFPPSKTSNLRNEIINFRQKVRETFHEAWDRFKDLLRACPHHGFTLPQQIDTFYNALDFSDQDSLNAAAGGYFLNKSANECYTIIESRAKVRQSRNSISRMSTETHHHAHHTTSPSIHEFEALTVALEDKMNLKMDTMSRNVNEMKELLRNNNTSHSHGSVKMVDEICVTCGSNHNSLNCP